MREGKAAFAVNIVFAWICAVFGEQQAALAFYIAANIWFAADIYRGKRGGTQAGGEKRWGAP